MGGYRMLITFCLVVGATVVMGAQLTVEIKVDVAAPKDVAEENLRKRQGGILDILSGGDFVEYMKKKDDWDRKYVNSPIERFTIIYKHRVFSSFEPLHEAMIAIVSHKSMQDCQTHCHSRKGFSDDGNFKLHYKRIQFSKVHCI